MQVTHTHTHSESKREFCDDRKATYLLLKLRKINFFLKMSNKVKFDMKFLRGKTKSKFRITIYEH